MKNSTHEIPLVGPFDEMLAASESDTSRIPRATSLMFMASIGSFAIGEAVSDPACKRSFGLPDEIWVPKSSHLPRSISLTVFSAGGVLGGGTSLDIHRGDDDQLVSYPVEPDIDTSSLVLGLADDNDDLSFVKMPILQELTRRLSVVVQPNLSTSSSTAIAETNGCATDENKKRQRCSTSNEDEDINRTSMQPVLEPTVELVELTDRYKQTLRKLAASMRRSEVTRHIVKRQRIAYSADDDIDSNNILVPQDLPLRRRDYIEESRGMIWSIIKSQI